MWWNKTLIPHWHFVGTHMHLQTPTCRRSMMRAMLVGTLGKKTPALQGWEVSSHSLAVALEWNSFSHCFHACLVSSAYTSAGPIFIVTVDESTPLAPLFAALSAFSFSERQTCAGTHSVKANFCTAGDQLVGSCRYIKHKILPCVLRVGLDGCQLRLGVALDDNGEVADYLDGPATYLSLDWYRADMLQGHRDSQQLSGEDTAGSE